MLSRLVLMTSLSQDSPLYSAYANTLANPSAPTHWKVLFTVISLVFETTPKPSMAQSTIFFISYSHTSFSSTHFSALYHSSCIFLHFCWSCRANTQICISALCIAFSKLLKLSEVLVLPLQNICLLRLLLG